MDYPASRMVKQIALTLLALIRGLTNLNFLLRFSAISV